ncbi:hypothetical protein GEMRC1_007581 [Eukaryota sp. GEM-RC1]
MSIYLFKHPLCKGGVRWEKSTSIPKEHRPKLVEVSSVRDTLVKVLADRAPAPTIVRTIEAYLPFLYGVISVPNLATTRHLSISWSSCVTSKQRLCPMQNVFFEAVSVHYLYAYATSILAHVSLLESHKDGLFSTAIPGAIKHLLKSASILTFTKANLLPYVVMLPAQRPVELLPAFNDAMVSLFLAQAQSLIVVKAEESGKMPSLIAKLSLSVYDRSNAALLYLKSLLADYHELASDFLIHIEELGNLFKIKAFRYLAKSLYDDRECGKAVALLRACRDHFDSIAVAETGRSVYWSEIVKLERKDVKRTLSQYETDLNIVFFQSVPPLEHIPIPESLHIAEVGQWSPPEKAFSFGEEQQPQGDGEPLGMQGMDDVEKDGEKKEEEEVKGEDDSKDE